MTAPARPPAATPGHEQGSAHTSTSTDDHNTAQDASGRHGWCFVVGTPAPQGSKRHVGRGILIESSKHVAPWRATVAATITERGMAHVAGPVAVRMNFYLARPASAPKKRTRPDRKPDLDKLVRSTLDAIVEAGWIEDDARVVTLTAAKHYAAPGKPTGVDLYVTEEPSR